MTDLYSPQAYNVRTTSIPYQEEEKSGGSSPAWIIFIIFLILIIIGLIIWLALSYKRNPEDRKIELAGANVEVSSSTSITGTWNQTASGDDTITLYATLDPPVYNSSGQVINSNQFSAKATGSQTSVLVSKLQPGLKYYATLVVTSSGTSNYAVYNQLVYMPLTDVGGVFNPLVGAEFEIGDILQVGRVEVDDNEVYFRQSPAEESAVLFTINSDGQIEDANNMCLYAETGSDITESILKVALCNDTNTINNQNSQWVYNHDGLANRWCLSSTLTDTNPRCMALQNITPSSRIGTIKVTNQSGPGDGWVNIPGFLE